MPQTPTQSDPLLSVQNLSVSFTGEGGAVQALAKVSFDMRAGETLCLVGESGCGKSLTARSILRVLDRNARIDGGQMLLRTGAGDRLDLAALPERDPRLARLRGNEVSMIYQEPMSALSTMYTIGNQITEGLIHHHRLSRREARTEAIRVMEQVGLPDPETRFDAYTFELSGGLRQRAMIAQALVTQPRLLIADEPTTALDVTTQAVILDLLRGLQAERDMAMLFITHDLGVVAEIADRVAVIYLGEVVEAGPVQQVLGDPRHPYTAGLLASVPGAAARGGRLPVIPGAVPPLAARPAGCAFAARCPVARVECRQAPPPLADVGARRQVLCHLRGRVGRADMVFPAPASQAPAKPAPKAAPLLRVEGLSTHFTRSHGVLRRHSTTIQAVSDVDLEIRQGETLGLVGESGCGKTTLGQTIIGLTTPTSGRILFEGTDITALSPAERRENWSQMRLVFQDPYGSLNPRMTAFDIVAEALRCAGQKRARIEARVREVFIQAGLSEAFLDRYPHAFSGGQRQRIGIARALAPGPRLIVADEPVSALDVSVQAQILNLLSDLQRDLGLTYLLISHDLAVVAHLATRVAVMYAGRIVELAETRALFTAQRHPYTQALLSAVLSPDPYQPRGRRIPLEGSVPDPANLPPGCAFAPRCPRASALCQTNRPLLRDDGGTRIACHHPAPASAPQKAPGHAAV